MNQQAKITALNRIELINPIESMYHPKDANDWELDHPEKSQPFVGNKVTGFYALDPKTDAWKYPEEKVLDVEPVPEPKRKPWMLIDAGKWAEAVADHKAGAWRAKK